MSATTYTFTPENSYILNRLGANNGIAELDSSGKVPASQLPSYVDDVVEVPTYDDFPITGESGKIYVDLSTNKTYRWGGSSYVEISESLALGETESTAYRGDRGKEAYDHAMAKGRGFSSGFYKVATNTEGHVTNVVPVAKSDIVNLGIPGDDFVGATTEAVGVHGYVPAPAVEDRNKFLSGNGTWKEAPGAKLIEVVLTPISNESGAYTGTTRDFRVTAGMKCIMLELGNPAAFKSNITVTAGAGTVTLTCASVEGESSATASFLKTVEDPTAITTSEFDYLENAKVDKAPTAVEGHFVSFNTVGNLIDSGYSANNVIVVPSDVTEGKVPQTNSNREIVWTDLESVTTDLQTQVTSLNNSKLDKPTLVAAGKFLQTDSNGDAVWGDAASPTDVANAVTNWLDDNIPTGQTVAIDQSLTINGAAADAKKTGDQLSDLKSALNDKVDSSMMQKCEVVEVEASANLWNEDDILTGIYHRNGTIYTGGNYDNFRYNKNRISVEEGDVLSFYYVSSGVVAERTIQYITCFTADGTINGNAGIANTEAQTYTIPSNVASVVLSVRYDWADFMVIKNAEQAPTEYIPYAEEQHYYVATNDFIPENVRNQLVSGKQNAPETAGTAGQVLGLSNNLEPVWIDQQQATPITIDDELSTTSSNPVQNKVVTGAIGSKVDSSLMKKCELVEIEETANKWNKDAATVGMLHTNGQIYTGDSYNNYMYGVPISVQPGDAIYFYIQRNAAFVSANVARVVCYDASGTVVSSSSASDVSASFTVPNDITSIIVTELKAYNASFMIIINDSTVPSTYIPYREADSYYMATDEFIPPEIISQAINDKVDKDGIEQVTAKNCEFVDISKNLFNPETVETGVLNKNSGALLPSYTTYKTSDWIEVEGSAYYTFSSSTVPYIYWVWYNSSKGWISGGEKGINNEPTKQAPANAKYIRFSILADCVYSNVQLEKGSTATSYRGFGTGYIKPEYMPPEETGIVFNIPKKVYALVGYETNIYFENLVEDWTKYNWDVTCTKGMQMERGYRITPESADVGTYTLTFALTVGNHVEQFSTTLVVVSASAGSGANESVIILGDSTTNNGIAVTKLNTNLTSDVYGLSTIGTRGTAPNKHEGRSGWKFEKYFQPASASDTAVGVENPWYNPTSETFDASYYFANSGIAKPDWFFINLGINDVFGNTSDSSLANTIAQCEEYLDAMIESMNDASPDTKIGICLTIPPNHSQDAFGKEYKCGQNRNRYKRNNLLWVNAIISDYDDREDEGIYLIPIHAALDTVYNMGLETLPVNARNTSITYESPIANGGVHPVESGYWQIADVYTAFLKAHANS